MINRDISKQYNLLGTIYNQLSSIRSFKNIPLFDIFGMPENFDIDKFELKNRYRNLTKLYHPDRIAYSPTSKVDAETESALLNRAFKTLNDDVTRSFYLLKMRGVEDDDSVKADPETLMKTLEVREKLEECDEAEASRVLEELQEDLVSLGRSFSSFLEKNDLANAQKTAYKMRYLNQAIKSLIP